MPPPIPPPVPRQEDEEIWYYVTASGRNGPVTRASLHRLAEDGHIGDDTLVWKAGMPDWVVLSRHQEAAKPVSPAQAPPLAARPATRRYLWVLALAPVWGTLLQIIATEVWVTLSHVHLGYYSQLWWIIVIANLAAASLDFFHFKKGAPEGGRISGWMFLLAPAYIYLREKRLKAHPIRFWVWTGSLALSLTTCIYLNDIYARLAARSGLHHTTEQVLPRHSVLSGRSLT